MIQAFPSKHRVEMVRIELPHVVDLLQRRLAGQIHEAVIDDLVGLSWLEWAGGSLQLTTTGANICRQQRPK